MLLVSEIMQKEVVSFRPETALGEAVAVLCERNLSEAPVISAENRVVGVISELTLMDVLFDIELKNQTLARVMSVDAHTIDAQSSLTQAIHMFLLYGVRQLPVVCEGKLVGTVSRRGLLALCEKLEEPLPTPMQELMPEFIPEAEDLPEERIVTELVDLS